MLRSIAAFPDQMRAGWGLSRQLAVPEPYRQAKTAAILGMGGSAVCGDLVRGIFGDRLRIPLVSVA